MRKAIFILLMIPFVSIADTSGLTWAAPIERVDGSSFDSSEIGGFRIYDAQGAKIGDDIAAAARAYSVPVNMMGQSVCMTTFDKDGRESDCSETVMIPANTTAPGVLSITVTFTISN